MKTWQLLPNVVTYCAVACLTMNGVGPFRSTRIDLLASRVSQHLSRQSMRVDVLGAGGKPAPCLARWTLGMCRPTSSLTMQQFAHMRGRGVVVVKIDSCTLIASRSAGRGIGATQRPCSSICKDSRWRRRLQLRLTWETCSPRWTAV